MIKIKSMFNRPNPNNLRLYCSDCKMESGVPVATTDFSASVVCGNRGCKMAWDGASEERERRLHEAQI
ncbi:hypothetical protein [Nitrosopumilus sp.]|uniref:hypothetical protein n=1 Tax=Nitrosopumilus sp. TaxID=2024843 RepID=UPI003D099919